MPLFSPYECKLQIKFVYLCHAACAIYYSMLTGGMLNEQRLHFVSGTDFILSYINNMALHLFQTGAGSFKKVVRFQAKRFVKSKCISVRLGKVVL